MQWIDNIKIVSTNLNIGDPLQIKGVDACGNLILGKYITWTDPAVWPLTWPLPWSCHEDSNCPMVQSLITNVLNLPWRPACCPGWVIWWAADCTLRSICPSDFATYFWFTDKYVIADSTDNFPWTLIDKLYSCNPDVLEISLDNSGPSHRIRFCLNLNKAQLKIIDLIDWPKAYPSCPGSSCGLLQSCGGGWNWLCPASPCASAICKNQFLRFNATTQTFQFVCLVQRWHASVWYSWEDLLYDASSPYLWWVPEPDMFEWLPCNAKWDDAWWYEHASMYEYQSNVYQSNWTWDIVIPETKFYRVWFHGSVVCNKYTHAYRYWVADITHWITLMDMKKAMRGNTTFGIYDSTFTKPIGIQSCDPTNYEYSSNLNEDTLTGWRTDVFWLEAWTRLRMYIKWDTDNACYDQIPWYPSMKLIAQWFNPYTNNHPKATSHWFYVEEVDREKIPLC